MSISIPTAALRHALGVVTAAVERAPSIPILAHLLVQSEPDILRLTGTNLETTLSATIELDGLEAGQRFAVPAHKLRAIAGAAVGSEIILSATETNVTVSSASARWRLPILPARDWPEQPVPDKLENLEIPAAILGELLDATLPACAKGDVRVQLNGINLSIANGMLTCCATDGHRLHAAEMAGNWPHELDIIIPRQSAQLLAANLPAEGVVELHIGNAYVRAEVDGKSLTSKLIDCRYMEWRRVVPKPERYCQTDCQSLSAAVGRVMLLASDYQPINLEISAEQISLDTAGADDSNAADLVSATFEGDTLSWSANPAYLATALSIIGGRVNLGFTSGENAILLTREDVPDDGPNVYAVVMPVRR